MEKTHAKAMIGTFLKNVLYSFQCRVNRPQFVKIQTKSVKSQTVPAVPIKIIISIAILQGKTNWRGQIRRQQVHTMLMDRAPWIHLIWAQQRLQVNST